MENKTSPNSWRKTPVRRMIFHLPTILYFLFIIIYPYIYPHFPISYLKNNFPYDKLWHFSVYFILPFFLLYSFQKVEKKHTFPFLFLIAIPWAFIDEFPQKLVLSRKFEIEDLLMDISGIVLGGIVVYFLSRRYERS